MSPFLVAVLFTSFFFSVIFFVAWYESSRAAEKP